MSVAPSYGIHTWNQTSLGDRGLCYRPSLRTFVRRLVITAVCALVVGGTEYGYRRIAAPPPIASPVTEEELRKFEETRPALEESLRGMLGDEVYAQVLREAEAAKAQREGQRAQQAAKAEARLAPLRQAFNYAHYGIIGLFSFIGLLAPLSCLWSRVTVTRTAQGELVIKRRALLSSTTHWPVDGFHGIRTFAMEHYGFDRYGRPNAHGWAWIVPLSFKGNPHLPSLGSTGVSFGAMSPQFHIDQEKRQPNMVGKAPEAVRDLVKGLRAITGLQAEPPQLVEGRIVGRRKVAYDAPVGAVKEELISREEHAYRRGEAIPEHIKARIAGMTGGLTDALPHGVKGVIRQEIVVRDDEGNEVTYESMDDLPEEVRRRLGL